jgi:NAD(P)-dependent dehydrogenase (short-subunit alcohol dehydrogenase family)
VTLAQMVLEEFSLRNEVAIVTGASRSIGRAIACAMAQSGAAVVMTGRSEQDLERVAAEIVSAGGLALPVVCDVTDSAAVAVLVAKCVSELGPPTVLVANAGVFQQWQPSEDLGRPEWDRVIATDLTGVMTTCQAVAKQMIPNRRGSIVTISSIAGQIGLRLAASYTAAKFGVVGLTRTLAADWAQHGIRVNSIAPGFIERDHEPLKHDPDMLAAIAGRALITRFGLPREVALAAVFLASRAASFVTGATLAVDGGWLAV